MYHVLYNFAQNNTVFVYIVSFVFALLYMILTAVNEKQYVNRKVKWAFASMTIMYFVMLYIITIGSRYAGDAKYSHFDLFWSYRRLWKYKETFHLVENVSNMIMFLPFGIFGVGRIIKDRHARIRILVLSMLLSISIEFVQLLMHRGCFDIDDVFHNVLGAFLGMELYRRFVNYFLNGNKKNEYG